MDIEDHGPTLRAGRFAMRVTNVGVVGNAFFDNGLSSDPSFEFPRDTGVELLGHGELWVGATDERGVERVSGGPMLEWRPTLDPDDRVIEAFHGRLGNRRYFDDDGDGRVDEEVLDRRDDDGDGEVDEDLGFGAQQVLAADYVDDRPEAVNYTYSESESHQPLGLSVHQEAYAWGMPGYDGVAGLQFTVTNHGSGTLRNVYLGFLADLDSRLRSDHLGNQNDRVEHHVYDVQVFEGLARTSIFGSFPGDPRGGPPWPDHVCFSRLSQAYPMVVDGRLNSTLPAIALVPLEHTTDPLAFVAPRYARAPARVSFRTTVFSRSEFPGLGGPPLIDADRYAALAGRSRGSRESRADDYLVLVSCGPFATLAPGQSLDFALALVAAVRPDTLEARVQNAVRLHHGDKANLQPDSLRAAILYEWNNGITGRNGHEVCLEAPPGVTFEIDPHCGEKFVDVNHPEAPYTPPVTYVNGRCVWTDADCDVCTGINGFETVTRWLDPGELPPAPSFRAVAGDHEITIEWDNLPEILLRAGLSSATPGARFAGYRVYKVSDWRGRESLMPPQENWSLLGAFGPASGDGEIPLASVTDSTLDYTRVLYEQQQYPVGRYRLRDPQVMNGFDYGYFVTTVTAIEIEYAGAVRIIRYESPLIGTFDRIVRPFSHAASASRVWVVPNPYRGYSHWDRPAVLSDDHTTHIDFMGLPAERSTIKIWTLAGDLVAQLDHDGTRGNGQAAWDLISRNGQDVVSGIYLFTVESASFRQTGRFVVVR